MSELSKSDHDKLRDLLALAAAEGLEPKETERVMQHVRSCPGCSAELEQWQLLAGGLDRKSTRLNSSHQHRSRMPSSA